MTSPFQPAYVVHIFPPCDFANENLARISPDLLHRVAEISYLLVVIATCWVGRLATPRTYEDVKWAAIHLSDLQNLSWPCKINRDSCIMHSEVHAVSNISELNLIIEDY